MEIVSARGRFALDGPTAQMPRIAGPITSRPPSTAATSGRPSPGPDSTGAPGSAPETTPPAPAHAGTQTLVVAPHPVAPDRMKSRPHAVGADAVVRVQDTAVRGPTSTGAPARLRPQAGQGGAASPPLPDAPAWPVYATHPPPPTTLHYVVVQGSGHARASAGIEPPGDAELEWTHDASTFSLRIAATAPGRAAREWRSVGGFDAAGIAPVRLAERERGRDKRAINFDREARRVRFSGASQALPVAPGAQDRWSWIAQLAAIAEGASVGGPSTATDAGGPTRRLGSAAAAIGNRSTRRPPPGTTWEFQVAGLRGELDRWIFRVQPDAGLPPDAQQRGDATSSPAWRASPLLHVIREPERPYDLRIEAWLSPAEHHLPIGLRMSAPPGGWSLALWPRQPGDDPVPAIASDPGAHPGPGLDPAAGP